ncbi:Pol polyprotein [Elysia marginata]|uniref:Pol polyprotein n=1 Tax=Elysia marginata TaxID=1093978 RepID=A0AAV4GHB7_9GAST|nr:Pol polyprotein [Elysia marginata]
MLLRIQPYNCTIQYKAGKEMIFADYLSRVSPTTAGEIQLDKIVHQVSISDEKYKALQDATAKDSELMCLKSQIIKGWPDNAKEVLVLVKWTPGSTYPKSLVLVKWTPGSTYPLPNANCGKTVICRCRSKSSEHGEPGIIIRHHSTKKPLYDSNACVYKS